MASKVRLPRKRFFSLKGNEIELAVGLLLVSVLDARAANATVSRDGMEGAAPSPDAPPPTLEQMLGVAPDAVKTITVEELKAHLTGAVLKSLGLDEKFVELLDHDRAAAIRELEAAYRKKLAAFAGEGSHHAVVAEAGEHAHGDAHVGADHDGDQDVGFLGMGGDISPLLILAGVAGVAAAGIIATSGGDDNKNKAPTAVNDAVTTNEDTPTTFDVRANDTDPNGDPLTVTQVNGTNITTTNPVTITGGVISLGADGRLTFTPNANFNGTPTFTYTVSDGRGGTATGTVNLTVTAVNDAPVNTVPGSIAATAGAALTVGGLAISDVDGAGSYTTTLKVGNGTLTVGSVTGGATVAGLGTGTLTLTGSLDQINATLKAIGYASGPGFLGNTTLTITTSDGSLTDTDTVTLSVSQVINGVALDGYIAGATVFLDANGNGVLDAGEQSTTTDANGRFAFVANAAGIITVIGGTNTDTGLPNTVAFTAPFGSTVVNPLTTLVVELMQTGISLDAAKAMVSAALGLPDGVDVTTFDFLSPNNDPAVALEVQKAAVEVATVLAIVGAAAGAGNASAVQAAVLDKIVASITAGNRLDLTDVTTVRDLISGVGLSDGQVNAAAAQTAAINTAVNDATSPGGVAETIVDTSPEVGTPPSSDVLPVTQSTLPDVVAHAADYAALGITTLDVVGDVVSLDSTQANALVQAGLQFADADDVTLMPASGEGTHLSTSLKGLAGLHVDTVMVGAVAGIDAGSGLDGISATGLPHFVGAGGIDPMVTLNVQAGTLNPSLDLSSLATALHDAGIDHIGVVGGELILSEAQALALVNAGITILPAADVGMTLTEAQVHALALDPSLLASASVDHLDVVGDQITLTDAEAGALIGAGVDFATGDDVHVNAEGTHLSTTLKGLADLHVDTVMVGGASHSLVIDAGASLATLSTETLPHFVADATGGATDVDVTLNLAGGAIDPQTDLTAIANSLIGAGIDHIGVSGSGALSLSLDQAIALGNAGLDFTSAADVTVNLTASQLASMTFDPASIGVDHLHVDGGAVALTDSEASALVAAGVDFVTSDDVQVQAAGTHLSSTLHDLQALHVDTIAVDGGVTQLHLSAGDLSTVTADSLPQFDVAQSDTSLDVTLRVDPSQLSELDRLGTALRQAGIDHFGLDAPLDSYDADTQAHMASITASTGIGFVYDPDTSASAMSFSTFSQDVVQEGGDHGLVQQIIAAFEELEDHGSGGQVVVQDDVIPALADSGALRAYTADTLVVDGTHSGDQLLTTLKDIADLGVDHVKVSDTTGPAFVDIGSFTGDELSQVKQLFETLDQNVPGTKIFEGNSKIALVVDESVAHALSQVDGGMEKLASMGFTEVDVLMNSGSTTPPIVTTAVEVKLIGQDDDLYKHLHHD